MFTDHAELRDQRLQLSQDSQQGCFGCGGCPGCGSGCGCPDPKDPGNGKGEKDT